MSVPEGWKLVPVEPTDAMLEELYSGGPMGAERAAFVEAYQGMLAAAPECVHQVGREGEDLYSLADIRAVLAVHWLTEIQCGHDTKTDRSFCWCGSFICEPQPSVGAAVMRWVEHVMAQLPEHRDAVEFVAGHQWAAPVLPKADRQCSRCGCAETSIAADSPCSGRAAR